MKKLLKCLLCLLPLALYFSFWPVIRLGGNELMNFELSVPLIWLVVFDAMGFVLLYKNKRLFGGVKGKWAWLLFPVWLSFTVLWSLNPVRGILTVGILWLICFAGYVMWSFREIFDGDFRVRWLKWFIGSTLVVCVWCVLQCILDLAGVSQDYSLMCDGCTYRMFGFPHPNGFAIEPQFMGNLLLAPAIVVFALFLKKQPNRKSELERSRGVVSTTAKSDSAPYFSMGSSSVAVVETTTGSRFLCSDFLLGCLFIITAVLFLTFSRGAIYAFVVGMVFVSGLLVFGVKKRKRGELMKKLGLVWGVVILSFVVTLNMQGLMTELSPTDDGYFDGISRVVNHLSLGVIDIRGENNANKAEIENIRGELRDDAFVVVENTVENFEENSVEKSGDEAIFDGYVAESTDTRMELTGAAFEAWSRNVMTVMFGVGIGGAGQAMYDYGLIASPKEIVQNEYASLLLETGLVGISLFVLLVILIIRVVRRKPNRVLIFGLLLMYGVTLLFFSGLPNALHMCLLPVVLFLLL